MTRSRSHSPDPDLTHEAIKITAKGCGIGTLAIIGLSAAALAAIILTHDPSKQPGMGPDSEESRKRTMLHSRSELDAFVQKNAETAAAIQKRKVQ